MELLAIFLIVPVSLYFMHERGRGRAWGFVAAGEAARGTGAYRELRERRWKRGAAPLTVRIAAVSSFFLGQMIVPGALAAMVGLIAAAEILASRRGPALVVLLELSAPTGLIVAARLLSAGSAMLVHAEDASVKARRAARWALGHNAVLLAAIAVFALALPNQADTAVPPVIYCFVSIAQALVVAKAAVDLDAYSSKQESDPAPPEGEALLQGR